MWDNIAGRTCFFLNFKNAIFLCAPPKMLSPHHEQCLRDGHYYVSPPPEDGRHFALLEVPVSRICQCVCPSVCLPVQANSIKLLGWPKYFRNTLASIKKAFSNWNFFTKLFINIQNHISSMQTRTCGSYENYKIKLEYFQYFSIFFPIRWGSK